MKILFLTADLGGNVPPTLAVAQALADRGVEVEIAGLKPGRTTLSHVPFGPATAIKPDGQRSKLRKIGPMMRLMTSRRTSATAAELISARRADLVVVDCMTPAVIRGALGSNVPVVLLFHTFGEFWARTFDRGAAGRLFGLLRLRPSRLWARAAARLLVTDAELDPGRLDPALAGYTWTGTTETGVAPRPRDDSFPRPRVLVALSTTDYPGMLTVYRRIVTALCELPLEAIVTTGGVDLGGEVRGAANVEVRGWADHGELLPTVDLMIGHGGHSTTMKALAHGVPLLVFPVNPAADQHLIGEVSQDNGLGRSLPKTASSERIRDAVRETLADDELRARAAATGRRLRALPPGAGVAADRVMAALDAREPPAQP